LPENLKVKFPPPEVNERQEAVEEFKYKSLDKQRIVKTALVLVILSLG
jgi:hypothetical protein